MVGMGWAAWGYPLCFVLGFIGGLYVGYRIWKRKKDLIPGVDMSELKEKLRK